MIYPRIIPVLLINKNKLIQTKQFKYLKYVGNPLNAVRIFNEKKVDELVFFDISATILNLEPNYELIKNISKQSRMPLCYGGGVKNLLQFEKIINLGVEKVSISSCAILNPSILKEIDKSFGRQSIIVTIDIKLQDGSYQVFINNGKKKIDIILNDLIKKLQDNGAGEILFNFIDRDGMRDGYDLNFLDTAKDFLHIPCSIIGGANSKEDFKKILEIYGLVGLCAGTMFSLKGKFNSVLLQYIDEIDKKSLSEVLKNKINKN